MIFLMQLLKMFTVKEIKNFIVIFDDLQREINELGYENNESELVNEMLLNHFGLTFEDPRQLESITEWLLKNQGKLKGRITAAALLVGKNI